MDRGFLKDYERFNTKVFSLDRYRECFDVSLISHIVRKVGAILCRAFDDCIVSQSVFKLLHIFGKHFPLMMSLNFDIYHPRNSCREKTDFQGALRKDAKASGNAEQRDGRRKGEL